MNLRLGMSMARDVRIVCVGNRLIAQDDLGPRVHDCLARRSLPQGIRLVDGGLQGLNLLHAVDGARQIVFVDALWARKRGVPLRLTRHQALRKASERFDHGAGLGYLLRAMEVACDEPRPAWTVVGAAGLADDALVQAVADLALAQAGANANG